MFYVCMRGSLCLASTTTDTSDRFVRGQLAQSTGKAGKPWVMDLDSGAYNALAAIRCLGCVQRTRFQFMQVLLFRISEVTLSSLLLTHAHCSLIWVQ